MHVVLFVAGWACVGYGVRKNNVMMMALGLSLLGLTLIAVGVV
jgi:hypothetical protein